MKNLTYILILWAFLGFAQDKDKALMQANDLIFQANETVNDNFVDAETDYRKAISKKPSNTIGTYNLGNAYYESGLYDEAFLRHMEAAKKATTKKEKHEAYHNIGNDLMKQKKCKEAVEAFKNALRNDPTDEETRYNLALAKECAKQQGQGDDDKKKDDDKDKKKDDQNKDKQDQKDKKDDKKDQKGDDQKKNEGDDKKDDNGKPKDDKENDNKDPQNQNKNQQQQPGKLSPQQIKNLLEAMNNQEKKVQEKINAKKAKGPKVKAAKDW